MRRISILFQFLVIVLAAFVSRAAEQRPPNVVLIFTDDQGYADIGVYGAKGFKTPNLDRMAAEGMRFTDFYVGQPVCSASRAALLTGCYPNRIGILGALNHTARHGINSNEWTLAEILRARGYATAIFGKWHLGHLPQFLPTRHGFDQYFGLPYSNDMWPKHPTAKFPDLPLIEGEKVIAHNPDQRQLTTWYTERAVQFIRRNKDRPFFLYVAHNMPHVPLHVSDKFKGKSERGLYGDVIMEIDWSAGEILAELRASGLEQNTLVIFTSDNGPWLSYGDHAGLARPLREGKGTSFDGGVREACLMRWPGRIPAGKVCRELALSMDIVPTVAKLAGAKLPPHRIDGLDIWPLMSGKPRARTPHEAYFYYWGNHLQAVRSGRWKLHFRHNFQSPDPPGHGGAPGKIATKRIDLELFDLQNDIGETRNLAARYPEIVEHLEALAEKCRDDLGDSQNHRSGRNVRPAGQALND